MKKILFVLALLLIPFSVNAKTSLTCNKEEVIINDIVICSLEISSNENLKEITGDLEYNKNSFSLTKIEAINGWVSLSDNYIELKKENDNPSTKVANFTFKVKDNPAYGNNIIKITNTNLSNNPSATIKILSENNKLSKLSIQGLSFAFDTNKTEYSLKINQPTITINATLQDEKANFVENYGSRTVELKYGTNIVEIKIKSESGKEKTYTLTITRNDNRSNDNYLSSLTLSTGELSPAFNKTKTTYDVKVPNNVTSITIDATLSDKKATFKEGFEPRTIELNTLENQVLIVVKSEKEEVRTYTINIIKENDDTSTYLKEIILSTNHIAFDKEKGYVVVTVNVKINNVIDDSTTVEFWHTTDKNTNLEWSETRNSNYTSNSLYNGGYLQIVSNDVEAIYSATYKKHMGENGPAQDAYMNAKSAMYAKIYATFNDGAYEFVTANGGTVKILFEGKVQKIYDRYYESQGKVIYGVLYDYIPAQDYIGYDTFDFVIHNGENEVTITNKVYIAPGLDDFEFETLNTDGTYLLSNDEWLTEVKLAYETGDKYIKTWVDFYEAQYRNHVPTGVPATARTPMEQLAILYKVTGKDEYFEKCWNEMIHVVKDEEFSEDGTRRSSWGEDSNGFLDAAMVTYSVAFTYNYIKDKLSDAQKDMVMRALYEEGFYYFENLNNVNVLLHGNNHNLLVCGNLAIAALSALSYEGEITCQTRDHGVQTVNVREWLQK